MLNKRHFPDVLVIVIDFAVAVDKIVVSSIIKERQDTKKARHQSFRGNKVG